MNETVTSVSKRAQKLSDAAAAVTVLSNEDLARSGVATVADALRLVPGMAVGSVNAGEWSVSARGFNGLYANKLLVLVDGRAVYSPLFAGVYWDAEQLMLEDVDRVEVIRGPGATVWGANAVNGVVNVVSRSARDTQGGLVQGSLGDVRESSAGVRYGGSFSEKTFYRVYAGHVDNGDHRLAGGGDAGDGWRGRNAGFRVDHHPDADAQLTWQGGITEALPDDNLSEGKNIHTLGRVTRRWSDRSGVEIQTYFDQTTREDSTRADIRADTFDMTAEHTFGIGELNDAIWGVGYRFIDTEVGQTSPFLVVRDENVHTQLFSAFAQNEFKIVPDVVSLTAGVKVEHNDYTGVEIQPSIRATYKPTRNQTIWSAVSRAVRTPAGIEGRDVFAIGIGAPFVGPDGGLYVPRVVGDPDLSSEVLWAYELGYRIQPTSQVSVDLALFYNDYSNVISIGDVSTFTPGAPVGTAEIPFANSLSGRTWGGEIAVKYSPVETWRLAASYSLLVANIDGAPAGNPQTIERGSPRNQIVLRSSHDLSERLTFDAQFRYVDSINDVPSYFTADLRVAYQITDALEISLIGQNLLQDQHLEQGPTFYSTVTEVPRGFYGKLTWRF